MPATWNLPRTADLWSQQDINQFNRLPVWMAMQQVQKLKMWSRWKNLFPKRKWKQNMGDILQGVIAENSPITIQRFQPNNITELPNKTTASVWERGNQSRVKRHNFESPQFNFLPSFRDFRTGQLKFAADDLNRQIAVAYDMFIRDCVLQNSPNVYIVNRTDGTGTAVHPILSTPYGMPPDPNTTYKGAGEIATYGGQIGPVDDGFLTYKQILAAADYARRYLGIMPYEGGTGEPGDDEILGGKYLLIGDGAIYNALPFDAHILNTKPLAMNLLNQGFKGAIGPNIMFKEEFYDLRYSADGSLPAPEIEELNPDTGYSIPKATRQTILNPTFATAEIGIAFLVGRDPYEVIDVGPPPSEFTGASIQGQRFNKLNWNGEVRLTDNLLVNYGSGNLDTNKYGEYLQLIADVVMGIIGVTPRNVMPIIFRRKIAPSL